MQDHSERPEKRIPAETQALLRILELGEAQVAAGEVLPAEEVIESILRQRRAQPFRRGSGGNAF
ncbi:MAG TPA: hypothetical protein PKC79_10415 [Solidesulfovibrio magneticus]|nr:hypothetical protein [Solidesulfovibrio magneticus]